MKKRDNRGVTLVELIIVMAILGVIIGMTGFGLGMITKKPVDECAKKIEMALNQNRTNAMGNTEAWLEFYMENDRAAVREKLVSSVRDAGHPVEKVRESVIGAKEVKVRLYYKVGNSESWVELDSVRRIGFQRDTGSLTGEADGRVYTRIEVYKGTYSPTGYMRTIELDALTGKVRLR